MSYPLRCFCWKLTKKRIFSHFLGMDLAGNVIFFPFYGKRWPGGWVISTWGDRGLFPPPNSQKFKNSVFLNGYPLNWKSSLCLDQYVKREREKMTKTANESYAPLSQGSQVTDPPNTMGDSTKQNASTSPNAEKHAIDYGESFRSILAEKSKERYFIRKNLRLNRFITWIYLIIYCSYCLFWGWLAFRVYLHFRSYLSSPERKKLAMYEHVIFSYVSFPLFLAQDCFTKSIEWFYRVILQKEISPKLRTKLQNWGLYANEKNEINFLGIPMDLSKFQENRKPFVKVSDLQAASKYDFVFWFSLTTLGILTLFHITGSE